MHYVKQFCINGVATKQVACIELQGVYDKIAARTRVVDYLTGTCTVITED